MSTENTTNNTANDEVIKLQNELINAQREIARMNQELIDITRHDSLTGAGNRKYLVEVFSEIKSRGLRFKHDTSMAIIDINNFKTVNETDGYAEGDRLLSFVAKLSSKKTRAGLDYVFRVGDDEFLIMFTNCNSIQASRVLGRINERFCAETNIASLAYGIIDVDLKVPNSLEVHMNLADDLMYVDKVNSRR